MHLFRTLLTLLAFVLIVGVANAGNASIVISPPEQEILIGGEGNYIVAVFYASRECGQHYMNISFYENDTLTDKLVAALQSDYESTNLQLVERGFGYYNYSWYASCGDLNFNEIFGSYLVTFNLVVAFNDSATEPVQVGDEFTIYVNDSLAGEAKLLAFSTAYAIAIPELLTFALVGAGVAVIFVSRKY